MWIILVLVAAVLIWFGVDALSLSRHASPLAQIQKDELIFGKAHRRPISDEARAFSERRFPIATSSSMKVYGWLFIVAGLVCALMALGAWHGGVS
jgi:hypothetical protein